MGFRPLADRVLVERVKTETKSSGGIILPEMAQERPNMGKVVVTGPGRVLDNGTFKEVQVKKGDVVLFGKHAGQEIKVDGVDLLLLRDDDCIGVYE